MPTELRHILFRPSEVIEAVVAQNRRNGTPLAPGTVIDCGPTEQPPVPGFRLIVERDHGRRSAAGERYEVTIEPHDLMTSLIRYCHDRSIPIPAKGDKSLQRFGRRIGLVVTLNASQDEQVFVPVPFG